MAPYKALAFVSVMAVSLFAYSPAQAQGSGFAEFMKSQSEIDAKNRAEAKSNFSERLKLANQGDAKAQYEVGVTYALPLHGQATQDDVAAFQWFLKSAQQGYLPAQEQVAALYSSGKGVEKNPQQAFHWRQKAAEQGSRASMMALAGSYEEGEGVAADPKKALEIYLHVAKKTDDTSYSRATLSLLNLYQKHYPNDRQNILRWMEAAYASGWHHLDSELISAYSDGKLAPPNDAKVRQYLSDKYDRSRMDPEEMFLLATFYEAGRGGKKEMDKANELFARLAKAGYPDAVLRETLKEKQAAAERGNAQAQHDLGVAYSRKHNKSAQDIDQAFFWLEKAAKQNHKQAQRALAEFYLRSDAGERRSQEKAIALYEDIARNGDADVQLELFKYYQGQDNTKALQWLSTAAQQGDARGQYGMGYVLFNGHLGAEKNHLKAVDWYLASAEQGYPLAMFEMGHMYDHGHGVDKNPGKALEWYEKSAKRGVGVAAKKVEELRNAQ